MLIINTFPVFTQKANELAQACCAGRVSLRFVPINGTPVSHGHWGDNSPIVLAELLSKQDGTVFFTAHDANGNQWNEPLEYKSITEKLSATAFAQKLNSLYVPTDGYVTISVSSENGVQTGKFPFYQYHDINKLIVANATVQVQVHYASGEYADFGFHCKIA